MGVAASTISGLTLTNENYDKAVEILKDRFGQRQAVISAYMNTLLPLQPVRRINDTVGLRNLYDEINNSIRSLESLEIDMDSYGNLLYPILDRCIPVDLMLFNRSQVEKKVREPVVSDLLIFLKGEIEACERSFSERTELSIPVTKTVAPMKERFGREDLLVQIYVQDLTRVMKNVVSGGAKTDLSKLYDELEGRLRALDSLGRMQEKFGDFLAPPPPGLRTAYPKKSELSPSPENTWSEPCQFSSPSLFAAFLSMEVVLHPQVRGKARPPRVDTAGTLREAIRDCVLMTHRDIQKRFDLLCCHWRGKILFHTQTTKLLPLSKVFSHQGAAIIFSLPAETMGDLKLSVFLWGIFCHILPVLSNGPRVSPPSIIANNRPLNKEEAALFITYLDCRHIKKTSDDQLSTVADSSSLGGEGERQAAFTQRRSIVVPKNTHFQLQPHDCLQLKYLAIVMSFISFAIGSPSQSVQEATSQESKPLLSQLNAGLYSISQLYH
ncbi:hypothetical protein HNY73_003044 [Argiope bruennichi]|uniref:Uncharacterized protein n=1 Tax=Argiope bruennichi TaxID=94029 RepID=A0A8T0FVN2_ARGBR|nr:hypothetical protein HNY73_003044 [Argiope bruennichi]